MLPAAAATWLSVVGLIRVDAVWSLAAALACLVLIVYVWPRAAWLALSLLGVAVVLAGLSWRLAAVESAGWDEWVGAKQTAQVEAVLLADAKHVAGGSDRALMRVRITRITIDDKHHLLRARATAFAPASGALPTMGERFAMNVRLTEPNSLRDVASLQVRSMTPTAPVGLWWERADGVREAIRGAQAQHDDQAGALVPALVMGDDSALDEMTKHDFRRTGLTHLLAVSGANLTIVLAVVLGGMRAMGLRRWLILAGLAVTVAFVLVARPEPSVQRAAVMGVVAVLGLGRSRSTAGLRALSWAVLVLLMIDPWLAVDFGFALSVLATGGIVLLAGPLADRFEQWAPRWFALALSVPIAAQLACLPVVAVLTEEVSLVSLAANMLAAPAVAPATVFGLAAGLLHLVWAPLSIPAAVIAWLSASWIVQVSIWSAGTAGAALPWLWSALWLVPAGLVLLGGLLRWGSSARVMGACAVLLFAIIVRPLPGTWLPESTLLVACDVGQGDGFVIPLEPGSGIVVDVGENPADIQRCLKDLRIKQIPLLVLSHSHADHVGGWAGAARGREIGVVLVGSSGAEGVDHPVTHAVAGDALTVGEARVEVLWPRFEDSRGDPNNESLVVRIEHKGVSILFTGDVGAETARRIQGSISRVDIIKVPHHGSGDMWPGLFELAEPKLAVIGVGAQNRHGHPHADVLTALGERDIDVARTDQLGTFAVTHQPQGFTVVTR